MAKRTPKNTRTLGQAKPRQQDREDSRIRDGVLKPLEEGRLRRTQSSTSGRISNEATDRLNAIPLLFEEQSGTSRSGRVVYDSWSEGHRVFLRDAMDHCVRHIVLKAGRIYLELVAERRRQVWEFNARIYSDKSVAHKFVLKAGQRKLLPETGGFYHWVSAQLPRTVKILSHGFNVTFEKLAWQ